MTRRTCLTVATVIFMICALPTHAGTPAGHWEGKIDLPGNPIDIVVDLDSTDAGSWIGDIDIPAQGLNGFPLVSIEVEGSTISFAMPGIPGDPVFHGMLHDDGSVLTGELKQGGAALPFRLERSGDAEIEAATRGPAVPAELASALAGRWEGKLEVPGQPMRVAFEFTTDSAGGLNATFDSPDQGQTGLPVSRLSVEGQTVSVELSYAGIRYEGTLDEARTQISGNFHQGGGSLPLVLTSGKIPPRALRLLAEHVQGLVDDEEIVGGELLVIKDRSTVYREAFGWKDREAKQPLEVDAIYCVRSMTKPLVGTAIQMLIDEGKLSLDTPVYEILPFFAGEQTGKITVKHLLTHTAGFPFTTIGNPLATYADLAAVAAEAATVELGFEPGSQFEYSDAGSDTLGAIVAKLTGAPVEQFIQQRILDPLEMQDTVVLLGAVDDAEKVLARIPSAYSGGTGTWSKHWKPSDPPMFPLFLGSQSLYSTTTDYARFLTLWMDGGELGDRRLFSAEAVERGLSPDRKLDIYPGTFEGLDVYYGQHWMVYAKTADSGTPQRVLFGHGGSDGTHAWAWPELDLIVLFFTQSRGTLAGAGMEGLLQKLLVDRDLDDPSLKPDPEAAARLEQVAGLYWDEDVAEAYYVIIPQGNRLRLERPGRMNLVFKSSRSSDTPDRYVHEANPEVWIEFVRSEDDAISAMKTFFGSRVETDPRHESQDGLPSVDEVIAAVKQAHRTDRLSDLGAIRLSGKLKLESRQVEGPFTATLDATRERSEVKLGASEQVSLIDADGAWTYSTGSDVAELEGTRLEQALLERLTARFGDWRDTHESVQVLKRIQLDDKPVLMVRVVPRESPGSTMFVDEASGRLIRIDGLVQLPGLGIVGVTSVYEDFRDVGGMQIPFLSVSSFRSAMIGKIVTVLEKAEVGVEVTGKTFEALAKPE